MKPLVVPLLLCIILSVGATEPTADLLHAVLPDSACIENREHAAAKLDSLAMLPGGAANVAAGTALLLRGNHDLGLRTLRVAVDAASEYHPAVVAAADFLVAESRANDSLSDEYLEQLQRKAMYFARIDSIDTALNLEIAKFVRQGGKPGYARLYLLLAVAFAIGLVLAWVLISLTARRKKPQSSPTASCTPEAAKAMLGLALASMQRLREVSLLVERKLAAGQSKDLYQSISSGRIENASRDMFFNNFDRAWNASFPDFGERLNALLKPEKRLEIRETLTPELRICALLSMGVDNSQELSQLLGLSVNTIYTYRNRMKGRALDRDNFESSVKNLFEKSSIS